MSDSIPPDIQIEQNIHHQRLVWKFERIGWMVMGITIIAACFGLFGGAGLFLMARIPLQEQENIQLEYARFGRILTPFTLSIHHMPDMPAMESPAFRIWFDEAYIQQFTVNQITPPPETVTAQDGRLFYHFRGQPHEIAFSLTPRKIGTISGKMGVEGTMHEIHFRQFIYP